LRFSLSVDGLTGREIGKLWDGIALTNYEKDVVEAIRILAPGLNGLTFVGDPDSSVSRRVPMVRVQDSDEPFPLRSLGEGMMRTLGIVLTLINAKDGLLLIDEFENDLYYSVLPELWQVVFQLAHSLNIQVFATTHRWDCIEAFQKAAAEDKQDEGLLVRLSLKGDDIAATLFDERRLGIATRNNIEVR
jgi:AAA15 family ATPase/GTPase